MGTLSARVEVDPRTFAKVIVFSQPVTPEQEASTYLYGSPARANLLSVTGGGMFPSRDFFSTRAARKQ